MPANWVHVSGCRAGSDCVFYQEGKGKFDFKKRHPFIRIESWGHNQHLKRGLRFGF